MAAGFLVQAEDVEVDGVEEGKVAEQDPAADSQAAKGSTVTIKMSSGPGQVSVPDVAGTGPGDRHQHPRRGRPHATRGDEASDTVPAGTVIRTDPAAGTPVEKGSNVTVVVSSGAGQVNVPTVQNLDESAAKSQLEAAGFKVQVTDNRTNDPSQDGKVVSQTPGAGSQADKGSTVSIVVNRFREPENPGNTTTSTTQPGGGGWRRRLRSGRGRPP